VAVLKPVNPSIATTSTPSRQGVSRSPSQVLNTCFDRPSTISSSRAAPVPSRIGVRSMITVTYLSPRRVWRQQCSSTPITRTPSNRCRSSINTRLPSASTAWFAVLTHDLQAKFVKTAERAQVRAHEGSVRRVAPIGHPRHEQVSSRLPSRLGSWASAPEFGELLGKGSALLVTGSSGGRTRRQIHHIVAECGARVAIREDRFDSAAACA
jgi:hypothetical protein